MDYQIDNLDKDVVVKVEDEDGVAEWFNLKNLINIIIDFINKLLKFEF